MPTGYQSRRIPVKVFMQLFKMTELSCEYLSAFDCKFLHVTVQIRIIWSVWLNGWVFVYELSGCGFESRCSHLNFRFCACFELGVPWHSGNYRVWIGSETRTWHDKNIQPRNRVLVLCYYYFINDSFFKDTNYLLTSVYLYLLFICILYIFAIFVYLYIYFKYIYYLESFNLIVYLPNKVCHF